MVQAVGPGASTGCRFSAWSRRDPAACCQNAGGQGLVAEQGPLGPTTFVPCWVPAAESTSVTFVRRSGQ